MTQATISQALNGISSQYIQEAEDYFNRKVHPTSLKRILLVAAILIAAFSLCAFTYTMFSAAAGDALILTATYAGDGILLAQVQNQSDRDLKLEPSVQLLYYSTNTPVEPNGTSPVVTGLTIPGNTTQTVRIDLRKSYNMAELEALRNDLLC